MSRTKRKPDPYKLDEKQTWKSTADRKRWYKPSAKAKRYLEKIRPANKSKMKQAMLHPDEHNHIILPVDHKTDQWYYN